jgi:hypothetical protein
MGFENKATVIYSVWTLDVWGDDGDWTVNDRRRAGSISVRTDRQNKAGQWSVSNGAIVRALVNGSYLDNWVKPKDVIVDGEDDGVLFIDDAETGQPTLQLEYERHHDVEEKPKGLFSEPGARESQENPVSSSGLSSLSTAQTVGLVAVGVAVVGGISYWLYSKNQAAQAAQAAQSAQIGAATLPVLQTSTQTPISAPISGNFPIVQTPMPGDGSDSDSSGTLPAAAPTVANL